MCRGGWGGQRSLVDTKDHIAGLQMRSRNIETSSEYTRRASTTSTSTRIGKRNSRNTDVGVGHLAKRGHFAYM